MLKNLITYAAYMQIYANCCICSIIFALCNFEKVMRKICDMRVLAKYVIAYSHITGIPRRRMLVPFLCIHRVLTMVPTPPGKS